MIWLLKLYIYTFLHFSNIIFVHETVINQGLFNENSLDFKIFKKNVNNWTAIQIILFTIYTVTHNYSCITIFDIILKILLLISSRGFLVPIIILNWNDIDILLIIWYNWIIFLQILKTKSRPNLLIRSLTIYFLVNGLIYLILNCGKKFNIF